MYDPIDEELAHIETIVRHWKTEIESSTVLPPSHWRARIYELINANHLSQAQFRRADAALVLLDRDRAANESKVAIGADVPVGRSSVRDGH